MSRRVDIALDAYYHGPGPGSVQLGREAKRNARLSAAYASIIQSKPISQRILGWRMRGEPRGHSFLSWSPWISSDGFRRRLHRMAAAGSVYAARQLALELVTDVRGVA